MLLMLACSSSSSTSGLPGSVQHTENALSHFIKLDTKVLGDDYPTAPDDQGGVGGDVEVLGGQASPSPHLLHHPAFSSNPSPSPDPTPHFEERLPCAQRVQALCRSWED